jgi:hypothetical protein
MAIRINLLAEAQAAEDARRRDPVKRAIWVSALLIALMLVWSSSVQLKAMMASSEVSHLEAQMKSHTNEFSRVLEDRRRIDEIRHKQASLEQLTSSRFLQGSFLNALQMTNIDAVQLVRMRMEQTYARVDEVKARTNELSKVIPGRPGTSTEKILVTLEANDCSVNPGDQVNKYKEAIGGVPYMRELLGKTNGVVLKNISPPTFSNVPGPNAGKASVQFSLECRLPEKTR